MSTFIIVLVGTPADTPYSAVKACHQKEPIMNASRYNSNFSQSFNQSVTDESLGTKKMVNQKTGHTVTCEVIKLQATEPINDDIKAIGCDQVVALGFTPETATLLEQINQLETENIKLKKQLKKAKSDKK